MKLALLIKTKGLVYFILFSSFLSGCSSFKHSELHDKMSNSSPHNIFEELTTGNPKVVKNVEKIPSAILSAFGFNIRGLANPREVWNSGCVMDFTLPSAKLNFAVHAPRIWLLHVTRGGIALRTNLQLLCRDSDSDEYYYYVIRPTNNWLGWADWSRLQQQLQVDWFQSVD